MLVLSTHWSCGNVEPMMVLAARFDAAPAAAEERYAPVATGVWR